MPIIIYAAGSLKSVLTEIAPSLEAISQKSIILHFGPAGLLREKIEQGAPCDLFLSANQAHCRRLINKGIFSYYRDLTRNSLCLTIKKQYFEQEVNWLSYLQHSTLRIATSTPIADPSGDYTWQLFDKIEQRQQGLGNELKHRVLPLVGGINTIAIPPDHIAATWLLENNYADIFIGYNHYRNIIAQHSELTSISIPDKDNIDIIYGLAYQQKIIAPIVDYLCSAQCQEFFTLYGYKALL